METVEKVLKPELYQLLWSLLPGFAAAWVFHGLTPHKKANQFERIIQALIFTAFIFPTVTGVRATLLWIGSNIEHPWGTWTEANSIPLVSVPIGILWGTIFASVANTNLIHDWLPNWVTKRTSYPGEWYSALKEERFVYLQLTGKRRIYGWPTEFPDHPETGHFILEEAEWILPGNVRAPLGATKKILIPAKKVIFVELEKRWDRTRWKPEQVEPYDEDGLATSVQLLGNLGQLEPKENKDDEPEPGTDASGAGADASRTIRIELAIESGNGSPGAVGPERPTSDDLSGVLRQSQGATAADHGPGQSSPANVTSPASGAEVSSHDQSPHLEQLPDGQCQERATARSAARPAH